MSKICLIRQPAGIGDIFYTQKIAKSYISQGYTVVWPVISEFEFIKDYIKVDGLIFVNENADFPNRHIYIGGGSQPTTIDETVYLPIQNFDRHYPNISVMKAKYEMMDMDSSDWVIRSTSL